MGQEDLKIIERVFQKARITGALSDSSIAKYRDSAKKFFSVLGNKSISSLELEDFDDFILKMKDNGASNSRIANVISAVKWIIRTGEDYSMIRSSIDFMKIVKPKIPRREVEYLTEDEIGMFLNAITGDKSKGPEIRKCRMMALIVFLLQTGARIGEALSINIQDIDRQNKEVGIIGKGAKPRTLFLTDNTVFWIDKYLSMRKDQNEALFVCSNGRSRWQQTDVGRTFRRYKQLSGIKKYFRIHSLRHTFATQYLMKGAGINIVQTALGHSDAVTTLKYYAGAVNKSKVKEMINDRHFDFIPEARIKGV